MLGDDEAKLPMYEVVAEAPLSHADGRTVPTITVTVRTNEARSSLRHGRAMAFWSAAHAELMLDKRGDYLWEVGCRGEPSQGKQDLLRRRPVRRPRLRRPRLARRRDAHGGVGRGREVDLDEPLEAG